MDEILFYLPSIATLALVQTLGVMSPGPDFALVLRNTILHNRAIGLVTVLGLTVGTFFHLTYTFLGIGLVIKSSPGLFLTFKLLSGGYLFYLGMRSLLSTRIQTQTETTPAEPFSPSYKQAFTQGLVTNILNPKAMLFFLSIFTGMMTPDVPVLIKTVYSFVIIVITLCWFGSVALWFSIPTFKESFRRFGYWINRLTGIALLCLALKIVFTTMD